MMPFPSFKRLLNSSVCISLTIFTSPMSAYALPESCAGACGNTHDPSLIRRPDGTYFRFSTGGKIAVHTAPSITGPWTYKGAAIPRGSSINLPGNQDLWAPDITPHNATHYALLYSVSTFGSQTSAIGLALSTTMDPGSWTDLGAIVTSSPGKTPYNAIDRNLFKLPSTNSYLLSFGSFWSGLYQTQISIPPTSGSNITPAQILYNSGDKAQEAPYVFYYENWYYLFYSKGNCCGYDRTRPAKGKEYKIMVCRSAAVPNGGFVDKTGRACTNGGGSVVLESHGWVYGPGGQGVYFDEGLKTVVLYYHYVDTRVGYGDGMKRFGWNKVSFSGGWPVV